jgi:hypothetical protein
MDLSGSLLFQGGGNALVALNLHGLTDVVVVDKLPFSFTEGLVKKSEDIVVVAVASDLIEISLTSGKMKQVGKADFVKAYLSEMDTLLYLYSERGPRIGLYEAKLNDLAGTAKQIVGGISADEVSVVPVSGHEAVFTTARHGGLWHYDVKSKALQHIKGGDDCLPVLYRSAAGQLVCIDWETRQCSLMEMHGPNRVALEKLRHISPVLYIAKHDVMVYTKMATWSLSERRDLYAYDFKTGESKLLLKSEGLRYGQTIYFETMPGSK